MLKCKIYAPEKKRNILLCQQDEELKSMLTSDPMKAQVHVVSLRDIRGDVSLCIYKYINVFTKVYMNIDNVKVFK